MWSFIRDLWAELVAAFGTAGLGLAGGAVESGKVAIPFGFQISQPHLAWASTGVLLVGVIGVIWRRQRMVVLKREFEESSSRLRRTESAVSAFTRQELHFLSAKLGHSSSERISLFCKTDDAFMLIGRHSANPTYNSQPMQSYPTTEGCLGQAWREGTSEALGLPDPRTDLEGWVTAQQSLNLPRARALSLTMKSRSYVAFRIEPGNSRYDRRAITPLGVIVFESEQVVGGATKLDPSELKKALKGVDGERIRSLLDQLGRAYVEISNA